MSRKLMRVRMDFVWPTGMIWKGYVNPYRAQKCKGCDASGYNPESKKIADGYYDDRWSDAITQDEVDALVAHGRLWDFYRVVGEDGWEDARPASTVTAEEVNAAARERRFYHDVINRCLLIETRAKRLGVWGWCSFCKGSGQIWQSLAIKRAHDAWKPFDPLKGRGFQLWETTSEGSPVSPVFASLDALCDWCAANASTFAEFRVDAASWKRMLVDDSVCHTEGSMVYL